MSRKASLIVRSEVTATGGSAITPMVRAWIACANRPMSETSPRSVKNASGTACATTASARTATGTTPVRRPSSSTTPTTRVDGWRDARRIAARRSSVSRTRSSSISRRPWLAATVVRRASLRPPVTRPACRGPPPPATRDRGGQRPSTREPPPGGSREPRPSPLRAVLSDVDALHDTEPDGQRHERGATVADERQRDPGDRHDADHHPDVHERLEQEHRGEPRTEQRPERVPGLPGAGEDAPQQGAEQHEDDNRADEPELLGQDREDEVALLDRKELAARLRPVRESRAEQPARSDRDLRLLHLPPRALRVGSGVQEREDPVLLVVAQHIGPGERDRRQRAGRHG